MFVLPIENKIVIEAHVHSLIRRVNHQSMLAKGGERGRVPMFADWTGFVLNQSITWQFTQHWHYCWTTFQNYTRQRLFLRESYTSRYTVCTDVIQTRG